MVKILLEGAVVIVLGACIALGLYMAGAVSESKAPETKMGQSETENNIPPSVLGDSDNDELMDWEEALWRTDPLNADSDGDGSTDGEETQHNRNPLQKGPNDELFTTVRGQSPSGIPALPTGLFPGSSLTKKPVPEETSQKTAFPSPEKVSLPQRIAESPEQTVLRAYGNEVAGILKRTALPAFEIDAFESFLKETGGTEASAKMVSLGDSYTERATLLDGMVPPEKAVVLHTAFTQKTSEQAGAIRHLATFARARDVSTAEWVAYKDRVVSAGKALYDLALLFRKNEISFNPNEDGSLFTLFR